jgi:hypothetical protein
LLQLPQQEMLLVAASPLVLDRAAAPHFLHGLAYAYRYNRLPDWPQTSWQDWLAAEPASPDRAYWQEMATQIVALPAEPVANTAQPAKPMVRQRLTAGKTAELAQVQTSYNLSLEEVVLTAVAQTLTYWQKSDHLWLTTAQYHRGAAVNGLNTRQTIGQLQTNTPLHLHTPPTASADAWLQQTKTDVRRLPPITHEDGISWPGSPQVGFVWQPTIPTVDPFAPISLMAPHGMTTPLMLVAGQIGDQLHLDWIYDPERFRHSTIVALNQQWQLHLNQLVAHTTQIEERQLAPADFPEAQLNQAQLSQFLNKLGQKKKS